MKFIKGAGVDLKKFKFKKNNNSKNVLLPARVIKEKGIEEFIIAALSLKKNTQSGILLWQVPWIIKNNQVWI